MVKQLSYPESQNRILNATFLPLKSTSLHSEFCSTHRSLSYSLPNPQMQLGHHASALGPNTLTFTFRLDLRVSLISWNQFLGSKNLVQILKMF